MLAAPPRGPCVGLRAGPPGRDTAVGFCFRVRLFAARVHLCERRAQRGPLVHCRVLGSLRVEPAGQHILALSTRGPDILFHCWILGEAEPVKERSREKGRVRGFTLEPKHMRSSGEGGGSEVWFDTFSFWKAEESFDQYYIIFNIFLFRLGFSFVVVSHVC